MRTDLPDEAQRWTMKRKAAIVLAIIKRETSAGEAARKYGLTLKRSNAGTSSSSRPARTSSEHIARLRKKVGAVLLDLDILTEATGPAGYFDWLPLVCVTAESWSASKVRRNLESRRWEKRQ